MQEASSLPTKDAAPSAERSEVAKLLCVLELRREMLTLYVRLMNELVLRHEPVGHDVKDIERFRRTLESHDAYRALSTICSDALRRSPPKSQHALAGELARDKDERPAMNQRVRSIVEAATAYGLIACSKQHRTRSQLAPTRRLDDLMEQLARQDLAALSKLSLAPQELVRHSISAPESVGAPEQ